MNKEIEEMYKLEPHEERVLNAFELATENAKLSKEGINGSIRGNGGSTNYYIIPDGSKELKDIMRYKNMNHSIGEAFCSLYRLNDNGEYERNLRKALFYIQSELDYIKEH